jgi:hypothetical protein
MRSRQQQQLRLSNQPKMSTEATAKVQPKVVAAKFDFTKLAESIQAESESSKLNISVKNEQTPTKGPAPW